MRQDEVIWLGVEIWDQIGGFYYVDEEKWEEKWRTQNSSINYSFVLHLLIDKGILNASQVLIILLMVAN